MLRHAARRAAGAAGVDDARKVVAAMPAMPARWRRRVGFAVDEIRPAMVVDSLGRLPGADVLDADDVAAVAERRTAGSSVLASLSLDTITAAAPELPRMCV